MRVVGLSRRLRLSEHTMNTMILVLVSSSLLAQSPREKLKLSAAEQKLVELTNSERKKAKLPPLAPNPVLFAVARAHTANMASQGKREHVLDGKDVLKRLDDAGYDWASARENIATSKKSTLDEVMQAFMKSKGHRANILLPKLKEIGVGIVDDGKGVVYYTQVFAVMRAKNE
jgi:uncharacterized protein YkwD